jgi:hypothetical protein
MSSTPSTIRKLGAFAAVLFAAAALPAASMLHAGPVPLPRTHAHNDYEHKRPLFDALDQGFCSVEADVFLVNGELLVAHNRGDVKPERTLQALYLDPLRERFKANGGHIYSEFGTQPALGQPLSPVAPRVEFTLLIDIKADGAAVYAKLQSLLPQYREMLTHFTDTTTQPGAITVILSGDRPRAMVAADKDRWCALDGLLSDLDANSPVHLVPLISESWRPTFEWFSNGAISAKDKAKLQELVKRTHAQGRRLRFWGIQDQPYVWKEFRAAGVDLINTDKLTDLATLLRTPEGSAAPTHP